MARYVAGPPRTHCKICGKPWPEAEQWATTRRGKAPGTRYRLAECTTCGRARLDANNTRRQAAAQAARAAAQAAEAATPRPTPKPRLGRSELTKAQVARGEMGGRQPKKLPESAESRFTDDLLSAVRPRQQAIAEQIAAKAAEGDVQMLKLVVEYMTRADDAANSPLTDSLWRLHRRRRAAVVDRPEADVEPAGGHSGPGGDSPEPAAISAPPGPTPDGEGGEDGAPEWGGASGKVADYRRRPTDLYPVDSAG